MKLLLVFVEIWDLLNSLQHKDHNLKTILKGSVGYFCGLQCFGYASKQERHYSKHEFWDWSVISKVLIQSVAQKLIIFFIYKKFEDAIIWPTAWVLRQPGKNIELVNPLLYNHLMKFSFRLEFRFFCINIKFKCCASDIFKEILNWTSTQSENIFFHGYIGNTKLKLPLFAWEQSYFHCRQQVALSW